MPWASIHRSEALVEVGRTLSLFVPRLADDLGLLKREHELRPDVLVVTGDLAEWGRRSEFEGLADILRAAASALAADLEEPRCAVVAEVEDALARLATTRVEGTSIGQSAAFSPRRRRIGVDWGYEGMGAPGAQPGGILDALKRVPGGRQPTRGRRT